jgi:hypothetical protein
LKNVLIITYYFPPTDAIGGVRPHGLAKYLPNTGWNPIILTPLINSEQKYQFTVIVTNNEDVVEKWKKRFKLDPKKTLVEQYNKTTIKYRTSIIEYISLRSSELIAFPDGMIGWYNHALIEGKKIIEETQIDAIISTSSPETVHLIAKELSVEYDIPWIADLRDLWTQNHYYQYSPFRRFIEKKIEVKTLSNAFFIVTVSQPWRDKLKTIHHKDIYAIPNGFDPDEVNVNTQLSKKFSILYSGALYKHYRDPKPLFIAIKELIKDRLIDQQLLSIDFFITDFELISSDIKKYGLEKIVHVHKPISREKILEKQRKSQILLILSWNDPIEKGQIPAKVFEYLAARRPIISIGKYDSGELRKILEITHAGKEFTKKEDLKKYLHDSYCEYINTGKITYNGIIKEIDQFSQIEMARKFSELLNQIKK